MRLPLISRHMKQVGRNNGDHYDIKHAMTQNIKLVQDPSDMPQAPSHDMASIQTREVEEKLLRRQHALLDFELGIEDETTVGRMS